MNMNERLPRMFEEFQPLTPFRGHDFWDRMFDFSFPMNFFAKPLKSQEMNDSTFLPKIDLHSDDQKYTLEAELPGMKKEDIHLEIDNGYLTLRGQRQESTDKEEKGYQLHERHFGSFTRSMRLPDDALTEQISAKQKDGMLTVEIPRNAQKQAQQIAVEQA